MSYLKFLVTLLDKVSLDIIEKAKPILFKPRPVPLAWMDKVKQELRKMSKDGILE